MNLLIIEVGSGFLVVVVVVNFLNFFLVLVLVVLVLVLAFLALSVLSSVKAINSLLANKLIFCMRVFLVVVELRYLQGIMIS